MNICCTDPILTARDVATLAKIGRGKVYTDVGDPIVRDGGLPEHTVMICNAHILLVLRDRLVDPLLRRPVSITPEAGVLERPISGWRKALEGLPGAELFPMHRHAHGGYGICYRSLQDRHIVTVVCPEAAANGDEPPASYLVNDHYLVLIVRLGFTLHEFDSGGTAVLADEPAVPMHPRRSLAIVERGRVVGALAPLGDHEHAGRHYPTQSVADGAPVVGVAL